jgi:predicted dehydrogenase
MTQHRLGIIMNGVTGRMGTNQHLIRSIVAIRAQGGVALGNGDRVMPDPILVGRNEEKLAAYKVDVDDSAYATFALAGGVIAHINSSWCTRVRRDDLVTFHVDGTHGSAVAGLQKCWSQARVNTPRPVWNPDVAQPIRFFETWSEVPDSMSYDNGFKSEWEMFIRHLFEGTPFKWTLLEGAKGVQLAEAGLRSWKERRWIDIPPLQA